MKMIKITNSKGKVEYLNQDKIVKIGSNPEERPPNVSITLTGKLDPIWVMDKLEDLLERIESPRERDPDMTETKKGILQDYYDHLSRLVDENDENDWKDTYGKVFTGKIKIFKELGLSLDYYDPDTSYYEDVMAYYRAFTEKFVDRNGKVKS